ncbi:MAG: TPM domain-containing protein [Nitrospirota bacterium]
MGSRILRCRLRVAVKSALLLFLAGLVLPGFVLALDVPPLTGRIVDTAQLITPDLAASLSQEIAAHERRTGNQVVVLTLPSLQGEPLEEFSHRVATTWKLGQKGTDNGVLLLVAAQDRRIRIEVGYGLEGVLTDAVTSRIIRNEMVPRFRAGEYSQGIAAGLRAILGTIEGTYTTPANTPRPVQRESEGRVNVFLVAVLLGAIIATALSVSRTSLGFVGGGLLSFVIALSLGLLMAVLAAAGAMIIALALSALFRGASSLSSGRTGGWLGGYGGGLGGLGGGFGGSGSFGGGFSGGGGGFGGGGASGSW